MPPTPNFADYPLRVDGTTIYDPKHDPRFPILTERFITTNDLLSNKRKETELKRLQNPSLEIKFEVEVKLQGLNPHAVFHVAKTEHKTTPAPFRGIHNDLERDPQLLDFTYGQIVYYNPILVLNTQRLFKRLISISRLMVRTLQILWFPTMTVKNNTI